MCFTKKKAKQYFRFPTLHYLPKCTSAVPDACFNSASMRSNFSMQRLTMKLDSAGQYVTIVK